MKTEVVDILLATYQGAPYVTQQIDSILAQDYPSIHLIIRDDCSTDHTREILQSYLNRFPHLITLIPSQKKLGIKRNFSCLMEHSKASYIMFSDQDDVWNKDKVSKTFRLMQTLEKKETIKTPLLIHTDLQVVDHELKLIAPSFWTHTGLNPSHHHLVNRLLMQNVVTGCTMMINRSLLNLAWPIPEKSTMHDWWLALVASSFGKINELPESTILYRQHAHNAIGAQKIFSLTGLIKGFKKLRQPEIEKQFQASELFNRYEEKLTPIQKKMLLDFKKLSNALFLQKVYLIFKHNFFKNGCLRNLINIFLKKQ